MSIYQGNKLISGAQSLNEVKTELNNKVDKVAGKQLSTNDFTNEDKQKLDGVNPNNLFSMYLYSFQNTDNGRIHTINGYGDNLQFVPTEDFQKGDKLVVNQTEVTPVDNLGELLTEDLFKANIIQNATLYNGNLVFRTGGSKKIDTPPNIFAQENEPPIKQGVWLQTGDAFDNIQAIYNENDISTEEWSSANEYAPMPTIRRDFGCVAVGTKIYCIGGMDTPTFNTVEIYDTISNTWSVGAPMPTTRDRFGCVAVGTKIYCAGGNTVSRREMHIYDTISNTWSVGTPMPTTRYDVGCSFIGNNIYFVGGREISNGFQTMDIYNIDTNTWSTSSTPTARYGLSCVAVNDKLYCIGGYNTTTARYLSTVEIYDPVTTSWVIGTNLTFTTAWFGCTAINNDIYCVGGYSDRAILSRVGIYNTLGNDVKNGVSMPVTLERLGCASVNNKIYCIGGRIVSTSTGTVNTTYVLSLKDVENTFFIKTMLAGQNQYNTQILTSSQITGVPLLTSFENAWLYKNGVLKEYPAYYGDGVQWVKFKN